MTTLLVRHAQILVTMDADRREIADGGLFARDGWIEQVGSTSDLPAAADRIIDLTGHVAIPGLVNTHHHMYQTLTRALPAAHNVGLFGWLRALYPIWAKMTPDHVRISTRVALAELALSGCTTAFDHHYLWPNSSRVDDQMEGASEVGIRFHVSRGSMSLGESQGGLPPDSVVEGGDAILEDCERVISTYHDASLGSMIQVVIAPCSPFSVTPELMKESATLARRRGVRLHTHLAETRDEEQFCRDRFGRRPVEYAEDLGWVGSDVWFAHAVHVSDKEVARMGATRTGAAHCPTSNMLLGSGTAPVQRYLDTGVPVGLGVDGSSSNDSSNMLAEARQAMLLARLAASESGASLLTARTALELATLGGASVLGREDIGALAEGKCADFAAFSTAGLDHAGAVHDPVAALLLCHPRTVDHLFVHGNQVVADRELVGLDLTPLIREQNRLAASLT
jgi:cytosine/adenosine deaminase-related metal-dependent hydrolase